MNNFCVFRELEGLIFQCGLDLDELKEKVELMQQEEPTCDAPPSPSPNPSPVHPPSEGGEILTLSKVLSTTLY